MMKPNRRLKVGLMKLIYGGPVEWVGRDQREERQTQLDLKVWEGGRWCDPLALDAKASHIDVVSDALIAPGTEPDVISSV